MSVIRFVALIQLHLILLHYYYCAFALNGCPDEFGGACRCGYVPYGPQRKYTYVTNCTNSGFDNALMLRKLPPETEVLIFVGNEVEDLPLNIFGQDIVYENLHTIDLSNNNIQSIKGRTFHNVANVTKLILNNNKLYIVSKDHHPRMFSNFVNLRELHLRHAFTTKVKAGEYLNNLVEIFENSTLNHLRILNMEDNEISEIFHGEFCSLLSLEELYLGENRLKDIPLDFSCMKHLKVLDVGNNRIPYLSDNTLKRLEVNRHLKINLTSNPFRCDCHMIKTYEWILTAPITIINRQHFYCSDGFPPIIGKLIISVRQDELQCVADLKTFEYHSSASFIALIIGFVCLVVVITVLIYKNRITVGNYMRRAIQPIRSKFHYVSLDRRDITMDV